MHPYFRVYISKGTVSEGIIDDKVVSSCVKILEHENFDFLNLFKGVAEVGIVLNNPGNNDSSLALHNFPSKSPDTSTVNQTVKRPMESEKSSQPDFSENEDVLGTGDNENAGTAASQQNSTNSSEQSSSVNGAAIRSIKSVHPDSADTSKKFTQNAHFVRMESSKFFIKRLFLYFFHHKYC